MLSTNSEPENTNENSQCDSTTVSRDAVFPRADILIGSKPRGAVRRVSLAIRNSLMQYREEENIAVLIGVSGGPDSLSLAACTIELCRRWSLPVYTVTVDHGIREGSAEEACEVADLLSALGAHAAVESVNLDDNSGVGPEGNARVLRREALLSSARHIGNEGAYSRVCILLGHTMDDQAETVLLRLARGSGVHSLAAMAPSVTVINEPTCGTSTHVAADITWLRPLLTIRRADTVNCCSELGLPWVNDPTNKVNGPWKAADGSPLRRSAIREWALPALASALGMDPVPALAATASLAAQDNSALDGYASAVWEDASTRARQYLRDHVKIVIKHRGQAEERMHLLHVDALSSIPRAVRSRVLRRAALEVGARGGDLSREHIDRMDAIVTFWHGQGVVDLPGARLLRQGKILVFAEAGLYKNDLP